MIEQSLWEQLSKINCSDHIEKKGRFNYLSWPWAWSKLKETCPNASFEKHFFGDLPYCLDSQGYAYVKVSVTCNDQIATEVYPVTDNANKSIKNPDSFAVNTALQRGMVKCMAYHGLGHYIYAGEDLPPDTETEEAQPPAEAPAAAAAPPQPAAKPSTDTKLFSAKEIAEHLEGFSKHRDLAEHKKWSSTYKDTLTFMEKHAPSEYQILLGKWQERKDELTNTQT